MIALPASANSDGMGARFATIALCRWCRSQPTFNHSKPPAVRHSSRSPRNLGRGLGSAHFLQSGWAGDMVAITRRFIAAGFGERVAALAVDADQTSASGIFQCLPDALPSHIPGPFRTPVYAPTLTRKRRRELGNLTQGLGQFVQAGAVHD